MGTSHSGAIGISAISIAEPAWSLANDWFENRLPNKFVKHTGIESRLVSWNSEVDLAVQAVRKLQLENGSELRDCAAVIFVSPSFIPPSVARKFLDPASIRREQLVRAAHRVALNLGIPDCPAYALNWFCSGYAKAMELTQRMIVPMLGLKQNQYVLIATASRISRITDYGCSQTGALFGDLGTVTQISRCDSAKYPVHFKLLHSFAERQPAAGVFFDFDMRENVLSPLATGGSMHASKRLVFRLDGMGIADAAPRAMSSAVEVGLRARNLTPSQVNFVVPHQAGSGIIRLTAMKLDQLGVSGKVINGLTSRIGNVSSCSIPYALRQLWSEFHGVIACPTAAVGTPGKAEVSRGCVLLQTMAAHRRSALAS